MSKLKTTLAFLAGVVLGGTAAWYIIKDQYAKLAEEEINSVKEAYAQKERKQLDNLLKTYRGEETEVEEPVTPAVTTKVVEKGSIADYARRIQNGEPMDYSRTIVPPKPSTSGQAVSSENAGEIPYVISPEEFSELEGYSQVSLTYFADGVLADEHGIIVDDVEEIVGDALNHFGEYEDDSVFVRNDAKRCDYEILRDEREYEEFRKTLPDNI